MHLKQSGEHSGEPNQRNNNFNYFIFKGIIVFKRIFLVHGI